MSTKIGHEPTIIDKSAPFVIGALFFLGFAVYVPISQAGSQRKLEASDCEAFKNISINEMPARCVKHFTAPTDEVAQ